MLGFSENGSLIALIVFFVFLLLYLWYAFSIVYHLIRFGIGTQPKTLALIFFIGSIIIFAAAITAYLRIDWSDFSEQPFDDPFY